MANLTFADQVSEWCEQVEGATEDVFRESVQELISIAQTPMRAGGRMRISTGFLWNSLMASTSMMPVISPSAKPEKGKTYTYNPQTIEAVIISARLGQTIYAGYTAAYAAAREFGARGQAPDAFVRTAAQRWPAIVQAKEAEIRRLRGL